ncbi:hypothetical protein PB2503_05087 [Parvularcula bermudensis HTCC2503]|uniref:Divergent polysaccharide deacetylase family protein n=1 Tax=Parvularcula bermudensis (strain ATCC BAA-594 / HTCC2503 / KCTC 12087) TaxID=314260 RepID=E0TFS7_PARBH|nr:divergent polysaccharide deacetylase family protein [Parvularcula bermudensis]ADM09092.1 hypothetical protein PB2503_05087 [Parvularcula bermudensis HTCC2503]
MGRAGVSYLRVAWGVLAAVMVIAAGAVLWAPDPDAPQPMVLDLPGEADRYAGAETGPGTEIEAGAEASALADGAETAGVRIIRGEAELPSPEVAAAGSGDGDGLATATESRGDGSVRITIVGGGDKAAARVPEPRHLDTSLTVKTAAGLRPARNARGATPFAAYRQAMPAKTAPALAVMVSGLGLDPVTTDRALLALPAEIGVSFSAYARNVDARLSAALAAGREAALEIPMATRGLSEAVLGPAALSPDRAAEGNATRLDWVLSRAPAYPYVTNFEGDLFASNAEAMQAFLNALDRAGLGYLDDTGKGGAIARALNLPYGEVDLVLEPNDPEAADRLRAVSRRALSAERPLIVKVYASDGNLDAVMAWVDTLQSGEVGLVPPSAAMR